MTTTSATIQHSVHRTTTPTLSQESVWTRIISTDRNWPLTVLRLTLAIVIFPHGAQKLLGWFGGYGFSGTMGFFTQGLGIPYVFGLLAIITEFFGAIALASGFMGRIAAFGIAVTMSVAIFTVHIGNGFFMNWAGSQAGEGFEYHLLVLGISLALMIGGSGALSLDRRLSRKH